ncbi:hypothetical protein Hanom_Chr07g00619091 [Helianthus anomalus]
MLLLDLSGPVLGLCGRCHRTGPKISRGPKLFKIYKYKYIISVEKHKQILLVVQWIWLPSIESAIPGSNPIVVTFLFLFSLSNVMFFLGLKG